MISFSWRLKVRWFSCSSCNRWWKNWLFDFLKTWTDSTSVRFFQISNGFKIRSRFPLFDWVMSNKSERYVIRSSFSKLERIQIPIVLAIVAENEIIWLKIKSQMIFVLFVWLLLQKMISFSWRLRVTWFSCSCVTLGGKIYFSVVK